MARAMKIEFKHKKVARGTNILDIEVPKMLEKTVRTGVDWFDDAMGGEGMTPSQVMLLTGEPGIGKTTFLLQLADSITGHGGICLYNTGEESKYQVRKVTKRLPIKHGFVIGEDDKLPDVLAHLKELQAHNKGKQVFLIQDSLQALDDGFYADGGTNSKTPLRCAQGVAEWAKETYGIAIMIGHVNKDGKFNGVNTIKHAIDTQGAMFFDDDKKGEYFGQRLFEVNKKRFGVTGKTFVLDMDEKGLRAIDAFRKTEYRNK